MLHHDYTELDTNTFCMGLNTIQPLALGFDCRATTMRANEIMRCVSKKPGLT